ncbi:MAG: hypothetical protein IIA88_04155 [Bacteroidetes bacterium]|nr:hypothetical protein [Bacteroidota bacterium]
MKLSIQYLNDTNGNINAVQIPLTEWKSLMNKLKKYEQTLKVKSDLTEAFEQVEKMRDGKIKKQTLSVFLNEI